MAEDLVAAAGLLARPLLWLVIVDVVVVAVEADWDAPLEGAVVEEEVVLVGREFRELSARNRPCWDCCCACAWHCNLLYVQRFLLFRAN